MNVNLDVDHDKDLPLQAARFAAPLLLVLTTLQQRLEAVPRAKLRSGPL